MNGPGEALRKIETAMTVKRVYGTPYRLAGVTIVPVARVAAGGGGGVGAPGKGWGGGFGVVAEPVGAFVIDQSGARFVRADVGRAPLRVVGRAVAGLGQLLRVVRQLAAPS